MDIRPAHVSTRSTKYSLGPSAEAPVARLVVVVLLILPFVTLQIASRQAKEGPSEAAQQIANFNPKQAFADNTPHFLPKPVAAMPGDASAESPAPAASEGNPADTAELGKVASTGRSGAMLRADPTSGQQVAAVRDGQTLEVLEHRTLDDTEWLRVRTADGAEGWIIARLVSPAQ
jgi:SH3 domain-containing protein